VNRVTRKDPCPVCGKPDWCGVSEDGAVAVCMRVESAKPARNGGWIHVLHDRPAPVRPVWPARPAPKPAIVSAEDMIDRWTEKTPVERLYGLSDALGVSAAALSEIGACWASQHRAWAFPMRDGAGRTVGIRLRSEDGRKWAVRGSREGLFYPESVPERHVAVICEGPTDTAAAMTIGLWAIGRPSCMGGVELVRAVCKRLMVTHLVIASDNDSPKARPNGTWWTPGLDGANALMRAVRLPAKLIVPPVKDLRAWVGQGLTEDVFMARLEGQKWRTDGW
jgi:hypothetical protein